MVSSFSSIAVEPGLHVLKYVAAKGRAPAPTVRVGVPAASRDRVELICAPGVESGLLDGPEACLVVRSEFGGTLDVVVEARPGVEPEAELRLDRLAGARAPGAAEAATALGVELVGHVARRGDVRTTGGWIAGPDAPAPIEGISARVLGADDVGIEYQVLPSGLDGRWSEWVSAGGYAGTRGQHRPLQAVRLRLAGPAAGRYRVRTEGLFLGSPIQSVEGAQTELRSASGADPLVGLKIALFVLRSGIEAAEPDRAQVADGRGVKGASRVRVFRASSSR